MVGPLDTKTVKQWIREGKILQNDLLREESKKEWHIVELSMEALGMEGTR